MLSRCPYKLPTSQSCDTLDGLAWNFGSTGKLIGNPRPDSTKCEYVKIPVVFPIISNYFQFSLAFSNCPIIWHYRDNLGFLLRSTNNWKNQRNNWKISEYVQIPLFFPIISNYFQLFLIFPSVFQFSNYL